MEKLWKTLFNSESDDGTWEIIHDSETQNVRLLYFPVLESHDTVELNKHETIELTYHQFNDLLMFTNRLNTII